MSDSRSDRDSVTEVAEESFVRERPLEIERGAALAGRYQVEEVIGKGGSGVVLRVFDRTVQNVVALKVLKSELARDAKWDKRFSRELRLGRPIQHPNVCRIFDIGEADGHRFLTMELATGGSLRDELKRQPALERPIEDRLRDARAAIEGLAAIHGAGVVHRDFKPDNLLRMEDGRLVISDFGLATDAASAPGVTVMIGTPHYMAPEVLAGEPATTRSDVWALGVVLHEIFFGRRPERKAVSFDGSQVGALRVEGALHARLLNLCTWCLTDAAGERPADARVVAQKLAAIVAGRPRRQILRNSWLALGAVGLVVTAAVAAAWSYGSSRTSLAAVLQPIGDGQDLASSARVLADLPGRVFCVSTDGPRTLTLVWGMRTAEEIDVTSGARRPARLDPDAYQFGCPQRKGQSLLFTARSALGAPEIRLSTTPTGGDAAALTAGSDPLWLESEDKFLYTVDLDHAAVFSIPTMSFEILSDPQFGAEYTIKDKAVSPKGDRLAVIYSNFVRDAVVVYDGNNFSRKQIVWLPNAANVAFGRDGETLLILGIHHEATVSLSRIDSSGAVMTRVGRYPPYDLSSLLVAGDGLFLIARQSRNDAWRTFPAPVERLTNDGRAYSAALSSNGDLLVSRRGDNGRLNLWRRQPGAELVKVTDGDSDVEPAFSPDGSHWAYADYLRRSVVVCSTNAGACHTLYTSSLIPTWPSFSPDGKLLVFMTQLKTTRFTVIAVADGRVVSAWEGSDRCPPRWSADSRVWTLEGGAGHYAWSLHDPRTGRRIVQVQTRLSAAWPDGADCAVPGDVAQPSGQPEVEIRSEERSRVLFVPSSALPGGV